MSPVKLDTDPLTISARYKISPWFGRKYPATVCTDLKNTYVMKTDAPLLNFHPITEKCCTGISIAIPESFRNTVQSFDM